MNSRVALADALLCAHETGGQRPDVSFDLGEFYGVYSELHHHMVAARNNAAGISREDSEARHADMLRNLNFYGAPHAAFLFMPAFGDCVRVASDIGMYAQAFLLSLTAHGLAGIPQTVLGFYPDTVREMLGVPDTFKLLFGISFGYADPQAPDQQVDIGRAPLSESVVFHG